MARTRVPIPLKLNQMVRSVSNELLVNAYAELVDSAKGTAAVRSHPGLSRLLSSTTYRGAIQLNDILYAVFGSSLYSVSSSGALTVLGTIAGSGYVDMDGGTSQLVILNADGNSWVWNGSALTPVTVGAYQLASSVAFLDGTAIWTLKSNDEFIWSAISDATMISGLDIASAEFKADKLRRALIYRTDLLLFGAESLEGWFDAGSVDTAYQRRGDLLLSVGLAGIFAVTQISDVLFWLAHDGTVRMLEAGQAVRISTASVERIINGDASRGTPGWTDLSQTRLFAHIWRGHMFITVRHPDGCVQYDLTTKLWNQRTSGSDTWRIVDSVFAFGQYLLFDADGKVYALDETTRYEDGSITDVVMVTPAIVTDGQPFILDKLDVFFDTGRSVDPNATPICQVASSDDGYVFVGDDDIDMGATGNYALLATLTQQGQTRERTYRFTISDDIPVTLTSLWAETRPCRG